MVHAVRDLIAEGRMVLLGAIRQEVLSGISAAPDFERLRDHLRAFPDEPLDPYDYEQAAEFTNQCSAHGVQGSPTDFLICAAAFLRGVTILTTDRDFTRYAKYLPIRLHEI